MAMSMSLRFKDYLLHPYPGSGRVRQMLAHQQRQKVSMVSAGTAMNPLLTDMFPTAIRMAQAS